jgi:hypothetical protein
MTTAPVEGPEDAILQAKRASLAAIRLEEQVKIGNDLLREVREAMRGPPRR